MADKIKIVVDEDLESSQVSAAKLQERGYSVQGPTEFRKIVWNGTALGGNLNALEDIDGEAYVVIGTQ